MFTKGSKFHVVDAIGQPSHRSTRNSFEPTFHHGQEINVVVESDYSREPPIPALPRASGTSEVSSGHLRGGTFGESKEQLPKASPTSAVSAKKLQAAPTPVRRPEFLVGLSNDNAKISASDGFLDIDFLTNADMHHHVVHAAMVGVARAVSKRGFMKKSGRGILISSGMKRRYFELRKTDGAGACFVLKYFTDATMVSQKGSIVLSNAFLFETDGPISRSFSILESKQNGGRKYTMECESEDDKRSWTYALSGAIAAT